MKLSEEIKRCLDGDGCDKCGHYEERSVLTCRKLLQAAYEEIKGYEELKKQCIKENSWCLRMLLHKWKEFIEDVQELYEYRKLEEQGKLLKLPNDFENWCDKIGDYIWFVTGRDVYPLLVLWIGFDENMKFVISTIDDDKDGDGLSFDFELEDLNKTVFLTKSEAEEALKKMNEREVENGNTNK